MAKQKKKRDRQQPAADSVEEFALTQAAYEEGPMPVPPAQENPEPPLPPLPMSKTLLDSLRDESVTYRRRTSQTIAELEEWRAEIDATIAILRAR